MINYYWVSWFLAESAIDKFELHSPWWVPGYAGSDENPIISICAAVTADSEEQAKQIVASAFDTPEDFVSGRVQYRFCEKKFGSPFSDRFKRSDWMKWSE